MYVWLRKFGLKEENELSLIERGIMGWGINNLKKYIFNLFD